MTMTAHNLFNLQSQSLMSAYLASFQYFQDFKLWIESGFLWSGCNIADTVAHAHGHRTSKVWAMCRRRSLHCSNASTMMGQSAFPDIDS